LLAASAVGLRLLLATPLHSTFGLLAGVQLFCETAMNLVGIQLWVMAARVFDPRQARRLFPTIATSGAIAAIGCALLLGRLAALIGVENLLLVVAASLAICWLCVGALARLAPAAVEAAAPAARHRGRNARPGQERGQRAGLLSSGRAIV